MKLTKRKIQAASDYRTFYGYSLDELEEIYPDIYADFFYDIRNDVDEVFISSNPANDCIGCHDMSEDKYYIWNEDVNDTGWYEVTFEELFNYLA